MSSVYLTERITPALLTFYLQALTRANGSVSEVARLVRQAVKKNLTSEEVRVMETILKFRGALAQRNEFIEIIDYGKGTRSTGTRKADRLNRIYQRSSISHSWGTFLFRLVRTKRPKTVLELGTNLGVSASYLAAAIGLNGTGRLVTLEGDPTLAHVARENLLAHTLRAEVVVGRFRDVLSPTLKKIGRVEMVFLDGHHEEEATREYFRTLEPFLAPEACVVFDDLFFWNRELRRAWGDIQRTSEGFDALNTGRLGLLLKTR